MSEGRFYLTVCPYCGYTIRHPEEFRQENFTQECPNCEQIYRSEYGEVKEEK